MTRGGGGLLKIWSQVVIVSMGAVGEVRGGRMKVF